VAHETIQVMVRRLKPSPGQESSRVPLTGFLAPLAGPVLGPPQPRSAAPPASAARAPPRRLQGGGIRPPKEKPRLEGRGE
jgi:hypothetical protein